MIKGVGRYVVEVEHVDSEFFERVICFVRPQYVSGGAFDLHREAARVADDLSEEVEEAQHGTRHVLRATPRRGGSGRSASPAEGTASDARHVTRDAADTDKKPSGLLPLLLSAGGGAAAALVISAFF